MKTNINILTLLTLLTVLALTAGGARAEEKAGRDYPLPEILAYFENPWKDSTHFGGSFCNVGDINNDGYSDLLIGDSRDFGHLRHKYATNKLYLFYGSPNMDKTPDLIVSQEDPLAWFGAMLSYVGRYSEDDAHLIAVGTWYFNDRRKFTGTGINLYNLHNLEKSEPQVSYQYPTEGYNLLCQDYKSKPSDFNGDGFSDLFSLKNRSETYSLEICGMGNDTIPYWIYMIPEKNYPFLSTGYDVNGDGYDDLMVRTGQYEYRFRLFLGGPNPSTEPVLEIRWDSVPERKLNSSFSLVPDVNGDGYDDWAIQFRHEDLNTIRSGFFLYYGSAQPDGKPDVELKGFRSELIELDSDVCGGDINGDGYGDIITGAWHANHYAGGIQIYFGHTEIDSEASPDININLDRDYQREIPGVCVRLGAIGDYNGDGVQDFVASSHQNYNPALVIFAGNRGWKVDSQPVPVPEAFQLTMKAYPNPFNSTIKISYTLPPGNGGKLTIFTTDGRILYHERLLPLQTETGITEWTAIGLPSGVYILRIDSAGISTTRKVVLMR